MSDRRRFVRIEFHARTELIQGSNKWPVELLDLSLKGLLIEKPEPWLGDPEHTFTADIHLSNEVKVKMEVRLMHDDHGHLGFVCEHIDLDSIAHLRRLVELNLADNDELERELGALIHI
ncbi:MULTISPECIES: PilZ domain-containing protein [unclassified Pseudomonas]|uniref:PilZ domain-containing protein n=1 Tax=unclassified Pseudomonas TaxID=196821 RepID=UPI000908D74F|nr:MULTISPECIES: PilZ domain-containing protein [unclassified Pseudomonas]MDB6443943.1 PilZ domain-containing protein [Pseudomonas sp. 21TX0197]ROO41424.1 pilus assembly protein [Pseudomonas sp. 7SR1]SFW73978.1 PilZ domain-containing protein [Pseudomonas sp. NFACC09-4]SFX69404.1 PilZ domain-containing protein [Pseudomonas sp. NFACC49-2]SFX73634.1 PilZ domain-containing protein [Pseudomonas sp. NFACC47-1]